MARKTKAATAKRKTAPPAADERVEFEEVEIDRLRPHPENYKKHPPDQIEHIAQSLRQFGVYKNVIVARDYTLLAGHGVIEAAKLLKRRTFPVRRLDLDPSEPLALKVLALDNELPKFGEQDDRALSLILKRVRDEGVGLLGTGYDDKSLAAFLMVTRPESEIRNLDEAAEWVGMPDYYEGDPQIRLVISFPTKEDRDAFIKKADLKIVKVAGLTWSSRWPTVENEDVHSLRFKTNGKAKAKKSAAQGAS